MKFKKYSSIENSYREKYIDLIREYDLDYSDTDDDWIVTEKVHGCLTGDTVIHTEYGEIPLEFVVKNKLDCLIKCFNTETKEITFQKILNWSEKENVGNWYEIETQDKQTIKITGEHLVWVVNKNKYVKVKDLKENDCVLID